MPSKPVGGRHTITLKLDHDGVNAEFACHEDNHGPCRWVCGLSDEIWDDECLREHPKVRVDYCNPLEFIDNDDAYWYEKYCGPEGVEVRSSDIELVWQNGYDSYGWRYAE